MDQSSAQLHRSSSSYARDEEIANALTHGIGIVVGALGLPILLYYALRSSADVGYKVAASIIYCVSMIVLYLASTLYHALTGERAKRILKALDHASIYLLIAGTYTPFALVTLRDHGGWWVLTLLWSMALIGMISEALWTARPGWVAAVIYLVMGWSAVFVLPTLFRLLDPVGFWLLVAGGVAYSLGTVFYVLKKVKWFHSIFHGWVLLGTVLHFLAILFFVIR
jgi:hemolysin III